MARRAKVAESTNQALPPMRPAWTADGKEGQMTSLAMDLVERRLREGTASSQETTVFIKRAFEKEKLEMEMQKMQMEIELMEAKKQALQTQGGIEELINNALEAFKRYSGHGDDIADY